MEVIRIAHLYYDLMNLYGENGNILAITSSLERNKIKYELDEVTVKDDIDFTKYDIYYIGSGTEDNLEIVREDILKYKKDITKEIKKKTFIATGNAYLLFGEKINNKKALGIFSFNAREEKERIVGEQIYKTNLIDYPIIGFQNRITTNDYKEKTLFEVVKGNGNDNNTHYEGIKVNNFYGTYLIGPLLIRNPYLKEYILKNVLASKKIKYEEKNHEDIKAYLTYLDNFQIK